MDFNVKGKIYKEQKSLRKQHSIVVEDSKAISYAEMALSKLFEEKYLLYAEFINDIIKSNKKNKFKVLNIGTGPGIVEKLLNKYFKDKLDIISIDNSKTFLKIAINVNKEYVDIGTIKFYKKDIIVDKIDENNFDIIFSRDLNHHLTKLQPYLKKVYRYLSDDGIFLMEDLRFDADEQTVINFVDEVFKIKSLKNNRWLLYLKLIGLFESFACAYDVGYIQKLLNQCRFNFNYFLSSSRYHFLVSKNKSSLNRFMKSFNLLREKLNGEKIIRNY